MDFADGGGGLGGGGRVGENDREPLRTFWNI